MQTNKKDRVIDPTEEKQLDTRFSDIKEESEAHRFNILAWPAMDCKNYTMTRIGNQWLKEDKTIIFTTNSNLCLFNNRQKFRQSNRMHYRTFFRFGDGRSVILSENCDTNNEVLIIKEPLADNQRTLKIWTLPYRQNTRTDFIERVQIVPNIFIIFFITKNNTLNSAKLRTKKNLLYRRRRYKINILKFNNSPEQYIISKRCGE